MYVNHHHVSGPCILTQRNGNPSGSAPPCLSARLVSQIDHSGLSVIKHLLPPSAPRCWAQEAAVKFLQPMVRLESVSCTPTAPHQPHKINTPTVNATLWPAGVCMCVCVQLIKMPFSLWPNIRDPTASKWAGIKNGNSPLISSEHCKGSFIIGKTWNFLSNPRLSLDGKPIA